MTDHVRGDLLSKRGTGVITNDMTFIGTGGLDPSVVDGQIIGPYCFETTVNATTAAGVATKRTDHTTFVAHTMPKNGSIVALALQSDQTFSTNQSCSALVKIGSTISTTCLVAMTSNAQSAYTTFAKGATGCVFSAGQQITVNFVHTSMTTTSFEVGVYIEM